ncbi:unnamed protein product [Protopolystoma xenopodis]|uniref:Uncharacterized protein n=1 Tax=Protopolystoma xenopodis TaxID=117903 RepID=A0A3S4ZL43_9PLAT|nr:unnamed protein product [Protopolystoma xenopodis]
MHSASVFKWIRSVVARLDVVNYSVGQMSTAQCLVEDSRGDGWDEYLIDNGTMHCPNCMGPDQECFEEWRNDDKIQRFNPHHRSLVHIAASIMQDTRHFGRGDLTKCPTLCAY